MPDQNENIPLATKPLKPFAARKAALILIALFFALAGLHTWISYRLDHHEAETRVTQLARTLEYQAEATFRSIDSLLLEASQRIDPDHWPDPELVKWFQSRLVGFPEARNMIVARADGRSAGPGLSANGFVGQPIDVSDRQHFRAYKAGENKAVLTIADPIVDRLDGRQIIPVSRPLTDSLGRFRGMVAVGIDPNFLVKSMESLIIEETGGISVIRRDGTILARMPDQYGSFGRSVAKSELFTKYLAKQPSGIARIISVQDGNAKIIGFKSLERYPLVATIGITERTAFAQWRTEAIWVAFATLVVSLALLIFATQVDRRNHALALAAAELTDHGRALEQQVAERTRHLETLQAESERKARQLAASNADLEQFAYVASHDLQEPLRTISSYVGLLERRAGAQLDDDCREYIGYAVDGAKRMHHLVQDLLSYSRVSAQGKAFEPVELTKAFEEARQNLSSAIEECRAEIACAPLPRVLGDKAQLVSLFQNLLGNAIKYKKPETVPHIRVEASRDSGQWLIRIKDDGIGIDPAYADRIFVIFQRLHGRGTYEGTGIGLALCKRIVERHGGRIWVESAPGEGSTFCFTLEDLEPPGAYL